VQQDGSKLALHTQGTLREDAKGAKKDKSKSRRNCLLFDETIRNNGEGGIVL
jgi:hypothetical protein